MVRILDVKTADYHLCSTFSERLCRTAVNWNIRLSVAQGPLWKRAKNSDSAQSVRPLKANLNHLILGGEYFPFG